MVSAGNQTFKVMGQQAKQEESKWLGETEEERIIREMDEASER